METSDVPVDNTAFVSTAATSESLPCSTVSAWKQILWTKHNDDQIYNLTKFVNFSLLFKLTHINEMFLECSECMGLNNFNRFEDNWIKSSIDHE